MSTGKALLGSMITMVALLVSQIDAESHPITFTNNCGRGTPILRAQNGDIITSGNAPITISGELVGAIAYLQIGTCGDNGEGCTLIETTLINGASSTDISLIPPHEFSVTSGFGYFDGCEPAGADCTNPNCPDAFHNSSQTGVQVACTVANCGLAITFCD